MMMLPDGLPARTARPPGVQIQFRSSLESPSPGDTITAVLPAHDPMLAKILSRTHPRSGASPFFTPHYKGVNHILCSSENHVQSEIHAADTCRFFQVLPHRFPSRFLPACHKRITEQELPNGLGQGNAAWFLPARINRVKMVFNILRTYS